MNPLERPTDEVLEKYEKFATALQKYLEERRELFSGIENTLPSAAGDVQPVARMLQELVEEDGEHQHAARAEADAVLALLAYDRAFAERKLADEELSEVIQSTGGDPVRATSLLTDIRNKANALYEMLASSLGFERKYIFETKKELRVAIEKLYPRYFDSFGKRFAFESPDDVHTVLNTLAEITWTEYHDQNKALEEREDCVQLLHERNGILYRLKEYEGVLRFDSIAPDPNE